MVPIAVHLPADIANQAKSLTLIIDRNPAPVAATFRFGDGFRAAAEDRRAQAHDARAHRRFLQGARRPRNRRRQAAYGDEIRKGAGGCSAPASKDADAALASLGRMQVKTIAEPAHGGAGAKASS